MSVATAISVRPAGVDDAAACAAILNDWIDRTDWMPRCHSASDVERHYREWVFARCEVWIAGMPPSGYLARDGEWVTALYVSEPGRGIGQALLDRVKAERSTLMLWTFVENARARAFYAREGFEEVRRTDGENEEGLPDILLRWSRDAPATMPSQNAGAS